MREQTFSISISKKTADLRKLTERIFLSPNTKDKIETRSGTKCSSDFNDFDLLILRDGVIMGKCLW